MNTTVNLPEDITEINGYALVLVECVDEHDIEVVVAQETPVPHVLVRVKIHDDKILISPLVLYIRFTNF